MAAVKYELPLTSYQLVDLVGEYYHSDAIREAIGGFPETGGSEQTEVQIELVPEPDNPYGIQGQAISARINNKVVGYLSNDDAARWHHELHRIAASGALAVTEGNVLAYWRTSYKTGQPTYELEINIRIRLPEPGHLVPLNAQEFGNVAVLPWGRALQVTGEDAHLEHLIDYVPMSGKGMVVLTLHRITHTLKNGSVRDLVEVRLDGRRVGQLTPASSLHFLPTIDHADDMGKVLAVWAKLEGSSIAVELTVHGARAKELSDDWLSTMPLLPRLVPEATSYDVPAAYTAETPTPAAKKQRSNRPSAQAQATASRTPIQVLSSDNGAQLAYFGDEKNTASYTNGKRTITIDNNQRRYSPITYKVAAWMLLITLSLIALISLAGAPIGLILTALSLYLGILGFRKYKLIAEALQFERDMTASY